MIEPLIAQSSPYFLGELCKFNNKFIKLLNYNSQILLLDDVVAPIYAFIFWSECFKLKRLAVINHHPKMIALLYQDCFKQSIKGLFRTIRLIVFAALFRLYSHRTVSEIYSPSFTSRIVLQRIAALELMHVILKRGGEPILVENGNPIFLRLYHLHPIPHKGSIVKARWIQRHMVMCYLSVVLQVIELLSEPFRLFTDSWIQIPGVKSK